MDPNACFARVIAPAAHSDDAEHYLDYISDLRAWLMTGGFGPSVRRSRDGAVGTLVMLTHTGDCSVRWQNNRVTSVKLRDLELAD